MLPNRSSQNSRAVQPWPSTAAQSDGTPAFADRVQCACQSFGSCDGPSHWFQSAAGGSDQNSCTATWLCPAACHPQRWKCADRVEQACVACDADVCGSSVLSFAAL